MKGVKRAGKGGREGRGCGLMEHVQLPLKDPERVRCKCLAKRTSVKFARWRSMKDFRRLSEFFTVQLTMDLI